MLANRPLWSYQKLPGKQNPLDSMVYPYCSYFDTLEFIWKWFIQKFCSKLLTGVSPNNVIENLQKLPNLLWKKFKKYLWTKVIMGLVLCAGQPWFMLLDSLINARIFIARNHFQDKYCNVYFEKFVFSNTFPVMSNIVALNSLQKLFIF